MSGDRWRWFNLVCVCANPAHMMALVRRGRGAHELCRFCSNIWSRAHEPIRKSLIRFSLCAENRCEPIKRRDWQEMMRIQKSWIPAVWCRSVTLPLFCLFVDFFFFGNNLSSQENVTLPCRLWLHPYLPPTVSLSLSLPFSFLSLHHWHREFSPSPAFHILSCPLSLFSPSPVLSCITLPSPARLRISSAASAAAHTIRHFTQWIY